MTSPKHVNEPMPAYGELPVGASAEVKGSLQAMRRAALRARQIAQQTSTDLIVVRSGKVVRVAPAPKGTP